jgi:hypothetical protein
MSLARAFTKRMKREEVIPPSRNGTVRYAAGTIKRNMISLPTELISTTNVQALTAPDIRAVSTTSSSGDSVNSLNNDSDFSTIDRSFLSSNNDDSSVDGSSPATPSTPAMDSARSFFDAKHTELGPVIIAPEGMPDVPAIPQRAPSHSKKAHVELSRKKSIQRMSPPPTTLDKPRNRASNDAPVDLDHPFGKELAKVNEIAEEFGATSGLMEDEEQELLNKGLHKFSVEDYINEIAGLYGGGVFDDKLGPMANPWM